MQYMLMVSSMLTYAFLVAQPMPLTKIAATVHQAKHLFTLSLRHATAPKLNMIVHPCITTRSNQAVTLMSKVYVTRLQTRSFTFLCKLVLSFLLLLLCCLHALSFPTMIVCLLHIMECHVYYQLLAVNASLLYFYFSFRSL